MVRIPSFSRGAETPAVRDENGDGRIDERDERLSAGSGPASVRDRTDDSTTYRSGAYPAPGPRGGPTDVRATETAEDKERTTVVDRSADGRPTAVTDRRPDDEPEIVVPAGRRPRASLLATLGLIFSVAAALFVLTGALAGYGIGLGVIALLLSIGGISATSRRHVAGKSDALIGLLLGVGAVVIGILAITGSLSWLTADAETVSRSREWLDSQFVNRF